MDSIKYFTSTEELDSFVRNLFSTFSINVVKDSLEPYCFSIFPTGNELKFKFTERLDCASKGVIDCSKPGHCLLSSFSVFLNQNLKGSTYQGKEFEIMICHDSIILYFS